MKVERGDFLLWMAHYGSLTFMKLPGPLETVVDTVARWNYDQMDIDDTGIPVELEIVGEGIVEGFFDLVRAREDELCEERKQRAQEFREKWSQAPADDSPRYEIYLKPSPVMDEHHSHLFNYRTGVCITGQSLTMDEVVFQRDLMEEIFGRERITVKENPRPRE